MARVSKAASKRAQDRISQKCRRERKSASRHLERAIETLESMPTADYNGPYSTLLHSHVRLLKDTNSLQEALLDFRKRLLSISNAAATAAEDDIFQKLFNLGKVDEDTAPEITLAANIDHGPNHSSGATSPSEPSAAQVRQQIGPREYQDTLPFKADLAHSNTSTGFQINTIESNIPKSHTVHPSNALAFLSMLPESAAHHVFIQSPTEFADEAFRVCKQYFNVESKRHFKTMAVPLQEMHVQRLGEKLASAFIRFLSQAAGTEPFAYQLGQAGYLERIVRWRLSNTLEDCAAIAPEFVPTRLQQRQNGGGIEHHMLVDFISWPAIRDQVITFSSQLDLDALQRDILANKVVEVPYYGVSLSLFDFHDNLRRASSRDQNCSAGYLRDHNWIFLKTNQQLNNGTRGQSSVESTILEELKSLMNQGATSALEPVGAPGANSYQPHGNAAASDFWSDVLTKSQVLL